MMTDESPTSSDSESDFPGRRHSAYSWIIPLITTVVVVAAVVMGLMLDTRRVPLDHIPEPPSVIPPAETLYRQHCAACHGADGQGVPGRYPPLVDTRWVLEDDERLILIVLHGLRGPIEVHGELYDELMAPLGHRLSDEEIAAILSYVRHSWGNEAPAISADDVAEVRGAFPAPRSPWTVDTLQQR